MRLEMTVLRRDGIEHAGDAMRDVVFDNMLDKLGGDIDANDGKQQV